jgi:hypothetical protein
MAHRPNRELGNRTSFAPETTSSKRNERNRTHTTAVKSTKLIDILPLITVWLQARIRANHLRYQ